MKRIVSVIIATLIMVNIFLFPAFASAPSEGQKVISPIAYRLLKFKMRNSSHEDVAREVLLSLGVPEGIANGMQNSEILEDVYNASDLNSYTEYTKIKPDGTSVEISKDQCLKEVAALQNTATTLTDHEYNEDRDRYFKKTLLALWIADKKSYAYWTCFEWITDPVFTSDDFCGVHTTDGSLIKKTGIASFSYTVNGNKIYNEYSQDDPSDSIYFTEYSSTLVFQFNLPTLFELNTNHNFTIAVIAAGKPPLPAFECNYNIYGTYYHRYIKIAPSVSVNPAEGSFGFSITPEWEYNHYGIGCDINYKP